MPHNKLINPTVPRSLSWGEWLKQSLLHPSLAGRPTLTQNHSKPFRVSPFKGSRVNENNVFKAAFLETFEFDGYDVTSNNVVTASGDTAEYVSTELSLGMGLAMFFGLPNRSELFVFLESDSDNFSGTSQTITPKLTWRQVIRNYFGGWNAKGNITWNLLSLFVKVPLILPIKLVGTLLKILLNTVKIFTEFLPSVIQNTAGPIASIFTEGANRNLSLKNGHPIFGLILGLIALPLLALHTVARVFSLVGRAITSPEKSARMAWAFGRTLDSTAGYVMATLGAAMSVALSVALWTILLPMIVGLTLTAMPQLVPFLTQLTQFPLLATSLSMIKGTLVTLSRTTVTAVGPGITALYAYFGVQVSVIALAVGSTLGVIVIPILTIVSRIADELSNGWVGSTLSEPSSQSMEAVPLLMMNDSKGLKKSKSTRSIEAYKLLFSAAENQKMVKNASNLADATLNALSSSPPLSGQAEKPIQLENEIPAAILVY
jgi:hypothetical protein